MFEFKKKIYGYECDVYGHLNNSNYLQLLEAARAEALSSMGIPVAYLNKIEVSIFIKRIEIDYIKPLGLEHIATIKTNTTQITRIKGIWLQEIFNQDDELCGKALVTGVFTKNGKPTRINKELLDIMLKFVK